MRMRNDWTLKEMSKRTGIPFSTLAKVEHDRLTLTYDKLQQLSERLKIRMSELFAEAAKARTAVTARRSIGRSTARSGSIPATTTTTICVRSCAANA